MIYIFLFTDVLACLNGLIIAHIQIHIHVFYITCRSVIYCPAKTIRALRYVRSRFYIGVYPFEIFARGVKVTSIPEVTHARWVKETSRKKTWTWREFDLVLVFSPNYTQISGTRVYSFLKADRWMSIILRAVVLLRETFAVHYVSNFDFLLIASWCNIRLVTRRKSLEWSIRHGRSFTSVERNKSNGLASECREHENVISFSTSVTKWNLSWENKEHIWIIKYIYNKIIIKVRNKSNEKKGYERVWWYEKYRNKISFNLFCY